MSKKQKNRSSNCIDFNHRLNSYDECPNHLELIDEIALIVMRASAVLSLLNFQREYINEDEIPLIIQSVNFDLLDIRSLIWHHEENEQTKNY